MAKNLAEKYPIAGWDRVILWISPISLQKQTTFFRLLGVSVKAGLGLRDALAAVRASENHRGLQLVIDRMIFFLTEGRSFSEALRAHAGIFGQEDVAQIASSEVIGNLPEVLQEIADENEKFLQLRKKIIKALIYPTILFVFTIVAVVLLLLFVVPTVVSLFPSSEQLPRITKIMISLSNFLEFWRWALAMLVLGGVLAFRVLYRALLPLRVLVDKIHLVLPVIAPVVKSFALYKFCKMMGQFLRSGLSSVQGLDTMVPAFGNFFYQKKLLEMRRDLEIGFSLAETMEGSKLFDSILHQIVTVGEKTGETGNLLRSMAEYYRARVDNDLAVLTAFVEPFLMAFVAIVIGLVVASVFLPLADLLQFIG